MNATFPLGTYWEDYEFTDAGHLDEYNGRWCVTPEYPDTIYAYFITQDASAEPQYPYIVGPEYFGVVNSSEIGSNAGNISIPNGTSCDPNLSINENLLSFDIFPNPATSLLTISGVNGGNYVIFDNLGRKVDEGANGGQIEIEDLNEGIYTLQLEIDNQNIIQEIYQKIMRFFATILLLYTTAALSQGGSLHSSFGVNGQCSIDVDDLDDLTVLLKDDFGNTFFLREHF